MKEGVLVEGGGHRTMSEHRPGPFEQTTKPTNAHMGPRDDLATHPGGDQPSRGPFR